jgi:hypothetical protein
MMQCVCCGSTNVKWEGPLGRLTHTKCGDCGENDCHAPPHGIEEGDRCGRDLCRGTLQWKPPENCSCHQGHAPCGSCTSAPLECTACDWESEPV